jgi:formyltetrahydrofolate-dependent phosphoribosylglycinamide formyltransferase
LPIIFASWLATTSFLNDFCRMLQKLQHRWKVNGINLLLIIFTFAVGGSICGVAAKKVLAVTSIENTWIWIPAYIILISLLWPFCVLLISLPFGQFSFFKSYLIKIGNIILGKKLPIPPMIAIFASGAGSNALKIINYFNAHPTTGTITVIVCNKPGAGVLDIAKQHHINTMLLDKEQFFHSNYYIDELKKLGVQFIVLAGFLWKVPSPLIKAYPNKIINIHPALLPKYGGKGMYGTKVHEAVIAAGESESGITIHYVDELYDHGNIIFQATCKIEVGDDANALAQKIHLLEHQHYPAVIEQVLKLQNRR